MPEKPPAKPKVLLIGWDAADWEHIDPLLEQGLLPTLNELIDEGVMGNLSTLQPILSPMLWNSVATGKHAHKHGIHGFIEPDPNHGGARPYSSYSRKTRALWNILTHEGYRSNVINWWASHPAEPVNGCIVSNAFGGPNAAGSPIPRKMARGTIHPEEQAEFLSQFRVGPKELSQEHLLPFIPKAAEINQEEDSRLETLAKLICETATTQAVATAVMEAQPWDFMAVYFTGIDHFSHAFMPYHPPRMKHILEKDFELFKDVVTGAYRFHDMILERLLQLAGPDTTVVLCSDHGFHSRELRPLITPREPAGPAVWHRRFGIFVAKGPGIKKDERIYGASLVDIAPTILTMFGLPLGEDMDGRSLVEIFEDPPAIKKIPSWDAVPGEFGEHRSEVPLDKEEAEELMRQFAALGYIDDPSGDLAEQAEMAEFEAKYNLAANLQWLKKEDESIPILEDIVRRRPWESRFILRLGLAYHNAGYFRQAMRLLEASHDMEKTREVSAILTYAKCALELDEIDRGVALLKRLEDMNFRRPGVYNNVGDIYAEMGRWDDAERAYRLAATIHDDSAEAHVGLSTVYRHRGKNQETIDEALNAVGLVYRLPIAHLNLGIALARSGDGERAVQALETALKFGPRMANAHRWLAVVHRKLLNDPDKADYHAKQFAAIRVSVEPAQDNRRARRETTFDLPELPTEEAREARLKKERPDRIDPRRKSGRTFVLVSGLPRSGTSLMMQMLEAGGLPPKTDGERKADIDNPKGYYEWEEIKRIGKDATILNEEGLDRKAIKCISMLLSKMPYNHEYKIIFMTRPIEEVFESQAKMIDRLNTEGADLQRDEVEQGLLKHRAEVLTWMRRNPRVQHLEIDYPSLVKSPDAAIAQISEFLGEELLPHPERMKSVVDASLYRRRKQTAGS